MRFVDNMQIVVKDAVGAAATAFQTATASVDMSGWQKCAAVLVLTQAGAGTATVTLKQGTTSTAATALAFSKYYKNETGVTTAALTEVVATTLTTAGAATATNVYVFEVKAEDLNVDDGYRFIRLDVASISTNTAAALFYILYNGDFKGNYESLIDGAS